MGRPREFDKTEALSAAMGVFWGRGFTGASMQELCDAMGINPGSLYGAYGGKQDLFHAVVKHYLYTVTQEGIGKIEEANSGVEGIRNYFDYIIEGITCGLRRNGCFGTNSLLELSHKDKEIQKMMTDHFHLLESTFKRALINDGMQNAASHAALLLCVAQGLNVLARTSPERVTLEQIVSAALATLSS